VTEETFFQDGFSAQKSPQLGIIFNIVQASVIPQLPNLND
jgi:hypothetical protein